MIIIADSGSTKTAWRLAKNAKNILQFRTNGINPLFHSAKEISSLVQSELISQFTDVSNEEVTSVFFYGAGCNGEERNQVVSVALKIHFPNAKVEVHSDMLGAAHALCGSKPGIAAILGTGSNSCMYDGRKITDSVPSLGFILGDEGSGAHLGRTLLAHYFYRELPDHICKDLEKSFGIGKDEVLENVYRQPNANRYIASFCEFLSKYKQDPFVIKMIYNCFNDFFSSHILKYPNPSGASFYCTGSIGFYFTDILRKVCTDNGVSFGRIVQSPAAGLMLYHLGE